MEIKQQCEQEKVCTRAEYAMRKHYFKSCFGTEELRASSQEVLNLKEISLQFGVHTWLEKVQLKFTGWKSSFAFCVQTTGGVWSLGKLWEGSESQSAGGTCQGASCLLKNRVRRAKPKDKRCVSCGELWSWTGEWERRLSAAPSGTRHRAQDGGHGEVIT